MIKLDITVNNIRYKNVESLKIAGDCVIIECLEVDKDGGAVVDDEQQYSLINKTWITNIVGGKIDIRFDTAQLVNKVI